MNKDLKDMPIDNRATSDGSPFRNNAIKKMEGSALFNHGKPHTEKTSSGSTPSGSARQTDQVYNYVDGAQSSMVNTGGGAFKPSARGVQLAKNRTGFYDTDPEGMRQSNPFKGEILRPSGSSNLVSGFKDEKGNITRVSVFDPAKDKRTPRLKQYNEFVKNRDSHNANATKIQNTIKNISGYTGPTRKPGSVVKKK
tara:strand:+ start:1222 stop:1809 length:588 start_codon:yes stop_codon:yes gene_type:complete